MQTLKAYSLVYHDNQARYRCVLPDALDAARAYFEAKGHTVTAEVEDVGRRAVVWDFGGAVSANWAYEEVVVEGVPVRFHSHHVDQLLCALNRELEKAPKRGAGVLKGAWVHFWVSVPFVRALHTAVQGQLPEIRERANRNLDDWAAMRAALIKDGVIAPKPRKEPDA